VGEVLCRLHHPSPAQCCSPAPAALLLQKPLTLLILYPAASACPSDRRVLTQHTCHPAVRVCAQRSCHCYLSLNLMCVSQCVVALRPSTCSTRRRAPPAQLFSPTLHPRVSAHRTPISHDRYPFLAPSSLCSLTPPVAAPPGRAERLRRDVLLDYLPVWPSWPSREALHSSKTRGAHVRRR